jgi:acetate kinase
MGLAGKSDMRDLRSASDNGDPVAVAALDVYRHRLVKYVGAYAAAMGGIDVLVFTAGVGENSFPIRQEVADRLGFLGLKVDPAKNEVRSKEPRIISPDGWDGPLVMVVPTNEELAIAQQSVAAIS